MKRKQLQLALLCAGVFACTLPVGAQQVYRCGNSYSAQPCPGGRAVTVEDERTAGQRAQTDQAVQRDAKAADALEKARLKDEANPAKSAPPPVKQADDDRVVKPVPPKVRKLEHFSAVAPRKPGDAPQKKKKAS